MRKRPRGTELLENRNAQSGGSLGRRDFLRLAGGAAVVASAGLLAACGGNGAGEATEGSTRGQHGVVEEARTPGGEQGRLLAQPARTSEAPSAPAAGLQALGLAGEGRDGLLYVPEGYRANRPAPLALMLHGAGSDAQNALSPFLDLADEAGLVLLAPDSRGRTWDLILDGNYGPDVAFIDRALEEAFGRLAVDAEHLAAVGFSDGASYALSLGLTNGELFTHIVAFSPGFVRPAANRGEPSIFVSHGTDDEVLPIQNTSRRIVPRLEDLGYEDLRYEEFDGPHTVPEDIAREALEWFV